jgi:hypothetical protein
MWVGPLLAINLFSILFVDLKSPGPSPVAIGYVVGTLFTHPTLAAAWTALGPGRLNWRVPMSIAWAALFPLVVFILFVGKGGGPIEGVVVVGGCLIGQWILLQAPFWTLAMLFDWALQRHTDVEGESNRIRFGIRHLLIVMVISSVTLGLGRITVSNMSFPGNEVVVFVFLTAAAIVVTLPLLLAALMRRMAMLGVLLSLMLIAVATAFELPLLKALGGSGPRVSELIAINVVSAVLILAVAGIVRLNGYFLYARTV